MRRKGLWGLPLAAVAGAVLLATMLTGTATGSNSRSSGPVGQSATTSIRIWTDRDRKSAVERVAQAWARRRGAAVEVVEKQFGNIRDDLRTVQAENAPDVIVAAHDWTGQLAADGSVLPLVLRRSVLRQVPAYARQAFSYGRTTSRLYGMPVALENVGLFVNTRLARVPRNFADLERQALRFKNRGGGRVALAVQQGAGYDAYHMYPLFSGLCGYIFGKTRGGALNPRDIGLASPRFQRNASAIDRWNRQGFVNARIGSDQAKELFLSGKAAFWITGPWNIDSVRQAGIRFQIVQVPRIRCRSAPFLGVQGFMVTKFARTHGVTNAAKDLVGSYMGTSSAQFQLAQANGRYPANTAAGRRITDRALRQIGRAGAGGVPMPNIPQMNSVWTDLGAAWFRSTRGAGATRARASFTTAARNIRNKIASGG